MIKSLHKQKGLTLIEVMISVTLGIIFLLGAVSFLANGQQSYKSQDTSTRIQENARFAIDIIQQNVRLAGYSNISTIAPAFIYTNACTDDPCSADTATVQGDRLAVSMLAPGSEDCLGTNLGADLHVANVFWVEQAAAPSGFGTISSLYCRGWDVDNGGWHSAEQPLVDGIDQMQVQYGIFNAATNSVDRYLNATAVEAAGSWADVRSVRVALLVGDGLDTQESATSGATVDNATFAANYGSFTLLDGAAFNPGDNRIRRVYTSTITINNAL